MAGPAELCAGHDWLDCDLAHLDDAEHGALLLMQRIARELVAMVPEHDPHHASPDSYRQIAAAANVGFSQVHNLRYGKAWMRVNTLGKIAHAARISFPCPLNG